MKRDFEGFQAGVKKKKSRRSKTTHMAIYPTHSLLDILEEIQGEGSFSGIVSILLWEALIARGYERPDLD